MRESVQRYKGRKKLAEKQMSKKKPAFLSRMASVNPILKRYRELGIDPEGLR